MAARRRAWYRFTGPGQCRWCGKKPPGKKRTWCSQRCVDAYLVESDPTEMRRAVLKRDRGVCRECGRDCEAIRQGLERLLARVPATRGAGRAFLDAQGYAWVRLVHGVAITWDVDHRVPIHAGGALDLSNVVTLCCRCHGVKSAAEATARAARRRALRSPSAAVSEALDAVADWTDPGHHSGGR